MAENLETLVTKIRARLDATNTQRDQTLQWSREIIRASANSIRATHRGEFDEAARLLEGARASIENIAGIAQQHAAIYFAGYVNDCQKEYAEAHITMALAQGKDLPDPDALGVEYPAYLNGLGEAIGEMRRSALDRLREGNVARAEQILKTMDDVFYTLVTLDYPDAVTMGLRRTTDMVRGVTEKTRGDLTNAIRQNQLEQALAKVSAKLTE